MTASYVEKIKMVKDVKILVLIKGERTHKAESSFKGSKMDTEFEWAVGWEKKKPTHTEKSENLHKSNE